MDRRLLAVRGACVGLALAACGADRTPDTDLEELRALLHDAPLARLDATGRTVVAELTQPLTFSPLARWKFDDCDPAHADLLNADGLGNTAFRSAAVRCTEGVLGQAVALAAREDIIYIPDQPYFTFEAGVTVAAWFRPTGLDRTQTLFRKRNRDASAFALVLDRGHFRFVVDLGDGRAAAVTAPARARTGIFQHVAASHDGRVLRLYVDGQQVAAREAAGRIPPGTGPLVLGNDGAERRFDGAIDEAVFDVRALGADQVLELTCVPMTPTVARRRDRPRLAVALAQLGVGPTARSIGSATRNRVPAVDDATSTVPPCARTISRTM
jgi:hypothetical protein